MKISISDFIVGKKYLLDTGFWGSCTLLYCGPVSWKYNFNFVACKSIFKILKEVSK